MSTESASMWGEGLTSGKAAGSLLWLAQHASSGRLPRPDLQQRGSRRYLNCGSDTEEATKALRLLEYWVQKVPSPPVTQACRYIWASSESCKLTGGSDAVVAWCRGTVQSLAFRQSSPAQAQSQALVRHPGVWCGLWLSEKMCAELHAKLVSLTSRE